MKRGMGMPPRMASLVSQVQVHEQSDEERLPANVPFRIDPGLNLHLKECLEDLDSLSAWFLLGK